MDRLTSWHIDLPGEGRSPRTARLECRVFHLHCGPAKTGCIDSVTERGQWERRRRGKSRSVMKRWADLIKPPRRFRSDDRQALEAVFHADFDDAHHVGVGQVRV